MVPNIKESTRSGIALQGIDREGNFFLEACDTTKAQSKGIAKQIAILATIIKKATQLGFSNIILLANSKGTEKRVQQVQ